MIPNDLSSVLQTVELASRRGGTEEKVINSQERVLTSSASVESRPWADGLAPKTFVHPSQQKIPSRMDSRQVQSMTAKDISRNFTFETLSSKRDFN